MRAKSFIKTSVNTTETRTQSVHLEEHCTRIEFMFHLFYAFLFLTNLVFKFNMVLIAFFFLRMSTTIYVTNLEVYPVPYAFL